MPRRPESVDLEAEVQRKLGAQLFNLVWTLLEKPDRDQRGTERMINAAHASRFFWEDVGEAVNRARGEWQLSRVYVTVGRAEEALHHAAGCLAICRENDLSDFDLGFAHEALARAETLAGHGEAAAEHARLAQATAARVQDAEDRDLLLSDLATLPS